MPGTHNRANQPPSNARVRRAAHLGRDRAVKTRKRLRRERAVIHRAIESAQSIVLLAGTVGGQGEHKPYRALDKRDEHGWIYVDAHDERYYEASRAKARAAVKRLNESEPITRESALRSLGFERVCGNKETGTREMAAGSKPRLVVIIPAVPVEEKFRLVES